MQVHFKCIIINLSGRRDMMKGDLKFSIKSARNYANLTQDEMARRLGVSRMTYLSYENGIHQMKIGTALLFSKITKVPIDNIIFFNKKYTSSV